MRVLLRVRLELLLPLGGFVTLLGRHPPFFDQEGGRLIYFEGTFTKTFSRTKVGVPRYDYNTIMYRLDLADKRLTP